MMVSIIEMVLYTKLTAEHQYLLRSSSHPLQNIRAFPFSLALRIRRICFFQRDAQSQSPQPGAMRRVYTITHTHTSDSPRRIPLVVG